MTGQSKDHCIPSPSNNDRLPRLDCYAVNDNSGLSHLCYDLFSEITAADGAGTGQQDNITGSHGFPNHGGKAFFIINCYAVEGGLGIEGPYLGCQAHTVRIAYLSGSRRLVMRYYFIPGGNDAHPDPPEDRRRAGAGAAA